MHLLHARTRACPTTCWASASESLPGNVAFVDRVTPAEACTRYVAGRRVGSRSHDGADRARPSGALWRCVCLGAQAERCRRRRGLRYQHLVTPGAVKSPASQPLTQVCPWRGYEGCTTTGASTAWRVRSSRVSTRVTVQASRERWWERGREGAPATTVMPEKQKPSMQRMSAAGYASDAKRPQFAKAFQEGVAHTRPPRPAHQIYATCAGRQLSRPPSRPLTPRNRVVVGTGSLEALGPEDSGLMRWDGRGPPEPATAASETRHMSAAHKADCGWVMHTIEYDHRGGVDGPRDPGNVWMPIGKPKP